MTFGPSAHASQFGCPVCGESHTRRVSLAYAAGTTQVRTSARGGDMLFRNGYAAVAGSTARTMLAKRLAPPRRHRIFPESVAALVVSLLLAAIIDARLCVPFAWLPAVVYAVYATRRNRAVAGETAEWEKRFVCMRCGDVFVPPGT
jgi:predicted RNA-binding Zn-ribbon protein involved in translation (DUF1610 family)